MLGATRSALRRAAAVSSSAAFPSSAAPVSSLLTSRSATIAWPSTQSSTGLASPADVAPADSGIVGSSNSRRRFYSTTSAAMSMEEFFPPKPKEGQAEIRTGRPWTAAELRLKSFEDLHRLWFVCLKERNMLLSDRLYYRQIGQAAPRGTDLMKVKRTMARIKVVLWERARAEAAYEADQARIAKLSPTDAAKSAAAKKLLGDKGKASGLPLAKGKNKTEEVTVTFKRFGRKHTVPASLAPEKLTRQQRRRRFASGLHARSIAKRSHEVRTKWDAIARAAKEKGQATVGGPKYNSYDNLGEGAPGQASGSGTGSSKAAAAARE